MLLCSMLFSKTLDIFDGAFECVQLYNAAGLARAPPLSLEVALQVNALLQAHGIMGGAFEGGV